MAPPPLLLFLMAKLEGASSLYNHKTGHSVYTAPPSFSSLIAYLEDMRILCKEKTGDDVDAESDDEEGIQWVPNREAPTLL